MENSLNRIMVTTIVKKAIRDLKTDPDRTVRNLVDMALHFADSRFQEQFYSSAQRLLANEKSGYYDLVKETLAKVNEESLLTFGMNIGYNGLYDGSKKIRAAEAQDGFNVPWTVALTIAEGKVYDHHHRAIEMGEKMGIHSWQLFSDRGFFDCLNIAQSHPDSSFVIFCDSGNLGWGELDYLDDTSNIAIMVPYDADADVVCDMLRLSGVLYGLYYTFDEQDLPAIESGALLHDMEQLHPAFAIFKPRFSCQRELCSRVYRWIQQARLAQEFKTIPWALYEDTMLVDSVISDDPVWVGFDEYGQLNTERGVDRRNGLNIFAHELPEILKRAFPKKKGTDRV